MGRQKSNERRSGVRVLGVVVCMAVALVPSLSMVDRVQAVHVPLHFTPLGEPGVGGRVTSISIKPDSTAPAVSEVRTVLVGGDMLGVAQSVDLGSKWLASTGLPSYEMADFTWDPIYPEHVWVGSMSGPALSKDSGKTFASTRAGMGDLTGYPYSSPVQRVVYIGDDTVLAFGGSQRRWSEENGHPERYGRVWVANRDGSTLSGWGPWSVLTTLPGNIVTASRGPDTNTLWAVVRGGTTPGVYKSTDAGASFGRVSAPGGSHDELSDLAVHPLDSNTLWVTRAARTSGRSVIPGAIYRTTNGGTTWFPQGPPPTTEIRINGVMTACNVDQVTSYEAIEASAQVPLGSSPVLYTSDVGQFVKKTYRSVNGGLSWELILARDAVLGTPLMNDVAYSGGADMFTLAVDPNNAYLVYAGSQEHLLSGRSDDASTPVIWTDRANSFVPGGPSPDLQNPFSKIHKGRGYSGLIAARIVFGPGLGQLSLNALDGGNLLQSAGPGEWTRPLATGFIRKKADGTVNSDEAWMDQWMGAVDTTYADANTIYVLKGQFGWFAGVAKSTNGGKTFTLQEGGNGLPSGMTFTNRKVTAIEALAGRPGGDVVFTMDGCIWRTTNGGTSWAKDRKSCALGLGDIVRDPNAPGVFYVQGNSAVYKSTDIGLTFTALAGTDRFSPGATAGKGRLAIAPVPGGGFVLYASSIDGTKKGLFRWGTGGWLKVINGYPYQDDRILDVAVHPSNPKLVAAVVLDHPYHDKTFAEGVFISIDGGANWTVESSGLGMYRGSAVAWEPMPALPGSGVRLIVGTYGQGFYETTVYVPLP